MATKSKSKIAPYPAELKDKLCRLVADGRSPEELSEEFGPSAQSIRNWVNSSSRKVTARDDTERLRGEVMRLRKVVQAQSLHLRALQLLVADSMPELAAGVVPAPASPFDVLGTPTE